MTNEAKITISYRCHKCSTVHSNVEPCALGIDAADYGKALLAAEKSDAVNHPAHYTAHPSGVECITITEHMGFNLGNAVKYIWRADLKAGIEDLRKAAWYVNREIEKRRKLGET